MTPDASRRPLGWGVRVLQGLSVLLGVLFGLIGVTLLFAPRVLVGSLGIEPVGLVGMATVRGDLAAVFLATAALIGLGLWRRQPAFLVAAATIRGLVGVGHLVGLALDGVNPDLVAPIVVEVVATTVLAATAVRLKSRVLGG